MIIFKTVASLSTFLNDQKNKQITIGFVPTMGALHDGHLFLIAECKKATQLTICSIFVNPTQFNDKTDFEKYPSKTEDDIALLHRAGCDVLFLPSPEEIYPEGIPLLHYKLGRIETLLEGKYRPGHFQGVCQVVHRLLSIIQPSQLLMGQKDYQQCMVVRTLLEITGINTKLVICPTIRESSGLAMSSRNMRLSEQDQIFATSIYQSLLFAKEQIATISFTALKTQITEKLFAHGFSSIDYIAVCNAITLEELTYWDPATPAVILIAAFINGVRLIDNMLL
ncbi:pantoate--beta-alanine ligase [Parasediminibacterium sp. JCM 36343]|uniref:pantoate--beta-alanine ligase n=1 Tax=Parasediminibacterium sp. JCM 36343 TaxID=3374279 RepID=UPI00397B52DA